MKQFLKIHSREELDVAEALIDCGFQPHPDGTFCFEAGPTLVVVTAEKAKTFDRAVRSLGATYFDRQYSVEYRTVCMRLSQALMASILKFEEQRNPQKKIK